MSCPDDSIIRSRETHAWAMRARGFSQVRIARELGLTQSGVSRLLRRVESRELRRMSKSIERIKAVQNAAFEAIIEESLEAWQRSKTPRKRAARKTSGDGQGGADDAVETTEVVERDGDCSYLYAAMNAMGGQRSLWGLDVAPALQEPASSIARLAQDLFARGSSYEQRQAEQGQPGDPPEPVRPDPGGVAEVPDGPEPVQRDDPVPGSLLEPPG